MRKLGFRILIAAVVLVVGGTLFNPGSAKAEHPIKIGAIYILSGVASTYGEFAKDGANLAVEEINAQGGVLGRPLEIIYEDSRIKADIAIQSARKLVYQDQVDVLMGLDSSGVARGVAPVIPELKRPFVITHAATPDVTGSLCNPYVFRISVNINQNVKAGALVAKETGARNWTTVGPDYAFGHQSWEFFQKYLGELSPGAVFMDKVAFPKFGTEDFTPFINTIIDAKPDGVFVSLWGGDLVNFVRQAGELGFFDQGFEVLLSLGAATEVLDALQEKMPENIWVGTRYWFLANDSKRNQDFVHSYRGKYGKVPSYNAQNAYAAVYAYKAALEKAGSVSPEKITQALSGLSLTLPIGDVTFRKGDHQATVPATWGKTKKSGEYPIKILDPVKVFPSNQVTPSVAATGCELD